MPLTLITGPHQSGKSRRLWELLRSEPPGTAVLVRPGAGLTRDLVRQVHAWVGPGWLPPILTMPELAERAAAAIGDAPAILSEAWVRHALRRWLAEGLTGTPWARLAPYRRTARDLADLLLRLDAQQVSTADLDLALRGVDEEVAAKLRALRSARRWLQTESTRRRAATPGARFAALHAAPLPWAALYLDDVLSLSPAEVAWLVAIAGERRVVVAAIDDDRCAGGLLERLRQALPDAAEERLSGIHPASAHGAATRALLPLLLPADGEAPLLPTAVVTGALDLYRYRDPVHAGRALAAWLSARQVPAAQVNCYVRAADGDALALADALRAAGIPVTGRFHVPYTSTAVGAVVAALGDYLARPGWEMFRTLAERLPLATSAPATAVPLAELAYPWRSLDEAFAALAGLATDGEHGDLGVAALHQTALAATLAQLRVLHAQLPTTGTWFAKLVAAAAQLAVPLDATGPALAALEALHPVDADDLADALALVTSDVVRDDGPESLMVLDAVRGRSSPRAVAVLHGLEHGGWPRQPSRGVLLTTDDLGSLGGVASDWYDERARTAGELAAVLACAARGTARLVIGIPCGEREPSAWLSTIAEQAGWDLEALRSEPDAEAVAGAPLGPHDSRGAHEAALWQQAPRTPALRFQVPPTAPADLGLKVSSLGDLLGDSFAVVCNRLALGPVLGERALMADGNELHALLAKLVSVPPVSWSEAGERLLGEWIAVTADPLERAARRRRAQQLRVVIAAESLEAVKATRIEAEVTVTVTLALGELGDLTLRGKADRIDHREDGVRVVDYKRGRAGAFRKAVADEREAQVLAYAQALLQSGQTVVEGAFVPLTEGKPVVIDLEDAAERWARLCASAAELASGTAHALPDGSCARDHAPIIRLAEYVDAPDEDES